MPSNKLPVGNNGDRRALRVLPELRVLLGTHARDDVTREESVRETDPARGRQLLLVQQAGLEAGVSSRATASTRTSRNETYRRTNGFTAL